MTDNPPGRALVVCYSDLERDPRVVRQIDWLLAAGWRVDTIGLGRKPRDGVEAHFQMIPAPRYTEPRFAKGLIHLLLPYRARFGVLVESQFPKAVRRPRRSPTYDLILVNDIDLLPWVDRHARDLLSDSPAARVHLDVHEYHYWAPEAHGDRITGLLLSGYHKWMTSLIASPAIDSRSTVADGIADLYATELGVPRPSIVRNSPPFADLSPTAVDPSRIELVYHGNAEMARGLNILVEAFRLLDERFVLNLMLTGSDSGKAQLRELTQSDADRVTFVDAVPMAEVAARLNEFDLEVIFYPPTSPNFLHSFPNKFFEAIQGRLGVVVGESPSMAAIIREYGNGVVVGGWRADELAAAINRLSASEIDIMKSAAADCARVLNSEMEKQAFFHAISAAVVG